MFPEFRKRIIKLMESGNFRLLAANGKRKWQTSVCLLQMETENRSLFSLAVDGNRRFLCQQKYPSTVGSYYILTIYAPVFYTAPCVKCLMRASA
jgi:hypothetical protein